MRLRTVLAELCCTAHAAGPGVDLDLDVVAMPAASVAVSFEQLLVLAPEGGGEPDEGFLGVTLVYVGPELAAGRPCPPPRTVEVASTLTREDFELAFSAIPETHVYLDLQRKQLFRAFQRAYDLQSFANTAYDVLGNPLMIVNSDRRLLASAGTFPENRPDVAEELEQGYISEEVSAELESTGILDDVRRAGHSIVSENVRFGQRWVTSIISHHRMEMGRFDLLEQGRTVTSVELELVDFAGSLAAMLIDRFGVAGTRAGSGSSVLSDILTSSFANEKTMRAQLSLAGMPLGELYSIMLLASEHDVPHAHLVRVAARLGRSFRDSLWTIHEGRLVVMVALGPREGAGFDGYERAERLVGERRSFLATLGRNGLVAYVCEPFEQLAFASHRFRQCEALAEARLGDAGGVVWFWRHRFAVLASRAHTFAELDMLLDKRVVAMSLYDRDHGTAYLETALQTVEHPGSPAEAARALSVHRNTYFYRVNKIAELFLVDLRCGEDRLAVAFSMHLLEGMGERVLFDVEQVSELWRRTPPPHGSSVARWGA